MRNIQALIRTDSIKKYTCVWHAPFPPRETRDAKDPLRTHKNASEEEKTDDGMAVAYGHHHHLSIDPSRFHSLQGQFSSLKEKENSRCVQLMEQERFAPLSLSFLEDALVSAGEKRKPCLS